MDEFISDEQAFTAAINEDPGDMCLRLVYADWLEERRLIQEAQIQREICKSPNLLRMAVWHQEKDPKQLPFNSVEAFVLNHRVPDNQLVDRLTAYAWWLQRNGHPALAKTKLWIVQALNGELGKEVFTKNQISGQTIRGRPMTVAAAQLQCGNMVVVVSRKPPSHYRLRHTPLVDKNESLVYYHQIRSDIMYLEKGMGHTYVECY
jgi:uncharacterized protein (TIGR02996 family)